MRRMNWLFTASIVALCGASLAVAQQVATEQPQSKVNGIVRVTSDPASGLTNVTLLTGLLQDDELVSRAIAKLSPEAAKSSQRVVTIDAQNNRFDLPPRAAIVIYVTVSSLDERLPSKKLLEALCDQLGVRLQQLDAEHQVDLVRVVSYEKQAKLIAEEFQMQREIYYKLAAVMNVSTNAENAAQAQLRLDSQLEAIAVELLGFEARQHALEEQIAEMGQRVADNAAKDPVVVELEKVVKIRQDLVEVMRQQYNANVVSLESVRTAESELAEHQAELAKFRREATQAAGGQRLTELRRRLEDTAIEMAEKKVKREYLELRKEKTSKYSSEVELKRIDIDLLERHYREMSEELNKLRRKLQLYQPPTVTLISAK